MRSDALLGFQGALMRGESARRFWSWLTLLMISLGPVLAIATAITLSRDEQDLAAPQLVRGVFLADLVYIIIVAGLVVWRVATLISARRARSAGSRLHLRLTGVFTVVALAPTILVAVFATLTVSYGIEGWFSKQVGSVVRNSLETAQAYEKEHRRTIQNDALAMASDLNRAASQGINDAQLGELLRAQARIREVPEAYVFDGAMELRARGEFSYLFSFEPPTEEQMTRARSGEVVVIEDSENNEIRALVYLTNFFDYYLYVTRRVDGDVLSLLDDTRETVQLYETLEASRDDVLLEFAALYLGFSLLVILASIWLGLWFAEKLARPIGRLAGAAQRVGSGDLKVRVEEERGDDEIAVLSRVFNRMIEQVEAQRDALVAVNAETEKRRRFMETVLSGVTAGVIRLSPTGRVDLMNEAAASMLGQEPDVVAGQELREVAPLFGPLFEQARTRRSGAAQDRVHGVIEGRDRDFMARVSRTMQGDATAGYVLTFDDLTELVSAQRMAAWGDVARRIAHEIKNPLTPIQLSVERLKRKFGARLEGEDRARFDQYSDMIVRQAGDIRRMVDEFNKFARMPAPELASHDLGQILREAVLLQEEAGTPIRFSCTVEGPQRATRCDRGLMGQALTNLLKNAAEAVESRMEREPDPPGEVHATLIHEADADVIRVVDNGPGLPPEHRGRLMEPYVTTREKGTGLGLAIVKKIAEEHGGSFALEDSPEGQGALAEIRLPLAAPAAAGGGAPQQETTDEGSAHG